jgi:cytochrome P450
MTRDEEVYPNADSFKPERFINNCIINKEIRDPRDIVFGFGRRYVFSRSHSIDLTILFLRCPRVCPGRYMAFSSLWMSIAAILTTLEIVKSNETVLPEDGRYFIPGTVAAYVSWNFHLFYLPDADDDIVIRSLSNAASNLAQGRPLT